MSSRGSDRIGELEKELGVNPASRQFYQLGELLRRDGRHRDACEVLRRGLVLNPRYVAAWVSLGRAAADCDDYEGASDALRAALALDPQNPVAWRLLGEARLALGDRAGALDALRRSLQLAPGDGVLQAAVETLAAEPAPAEAGIGAAPLGEEPLAPALASPAEPEWAVYTAEPAAPGAPPPIADPFAAAAPVAPAAGDVFAEVFEAPAPLPRLDSGVFSFSGAPLAPPPPVERAPVVEVAPAALLETPAPESGAPPLAADLDEAFAAALAAPPPPVAEPEPAPQAAWVEQAAAPRREPEPEPAPEPEPMPAPAAPAQEPRPRPTVTLARLYIGQQQFAAAADVLEEVLDTQPSSQEARDLLDLVRDMMEPLPGALPPLSPRERKIAALQRWLASLTLGRERALN